MVYTIDKIVSAAPNLIFIYHLGNSYKCPEHKKITARILLCYMFSVIMKSIFRRNRRERSFEFKSWDFGKYTSFLNHMKGGYSFPSSHAIFFCNYYLLTPNIYTLMLFIFGTFYRIYYEHHTISEVIAGVVTGACLFAAIRELERRWGKFKTLNSE